MASTILSDNGVTSGSAGIKQTADNSGVLALQTSTAGGTATTALTIDTSQNVGIGTSSPAQKLDISAAGAQIALRSTDTTAARFRGYVNGSESGVIGFLSGGGQYFETVGTERMRLDASGNLLVGTTSSAARITALGASTTSANIALLVGNSSGQDIFYARCDGYINTGSRTASPYNNTTASAANMYVDNLGGLYRSTSSLKYKTDVQDATHGLAKVLSLRSVTYKGKNDGDTIFGGLIAEEVHAAGLTEFVQYAEDGTPDALAYGQMVSLAFKAIQEQQALIQQLQADVAALKGA